MPTTTLIDAFPTNRIIQTFTDLDADRLASMVAEIVSQQDSGSHPMPEIRSLARELETSSGIPFSAALDLAMKRIPMEAATRWIRDRTATKPAISTPRALVVVSGGVADFATDPDVDLFVFDQDNYESDPNGTDLVPASHADLAEPFNAPVAAA